MPFCGLLLLLSVHSLEVRGALLLAAVKDRRSGCALAAFSERTRRREAGLRSIVEVNGSVVELFKLSCGRRGNDEHLGQWQTTANGCG